jgi:polysaccharide biosynthesis/export protein
VVFAFDLSTGDGLFAARSFPVHPDDVVQATESPLPAAGSLLGVFGAVLGIGQRLEGL